MCGHQPHNEMLIEGLDGMVCCVPLVEMQWHQLEELIFVFHILLQEVGAFIIKDMDLLLQATATQQVSIFYL